jgi:hypothetical protein
MAEGPFPCSGRTDLFFPERGTSISRIAKAKALCAGCDYLDPCREGAIARGERFGIWGGLTNQSIKKSRRGTRYAGESRTEIYADLPSDRAVSA